MVREDSPLFVEPIADNENRSIKIASNIILSHTSYPAKNKNAKKGVPIMWIDENSIVSTPDISMRILGAICPSKYGNFVMRYYIEITNKSNSMIYIDKASSFRINDGDIAKSFYDNKVININHSHGAGIGIGLGGIAGNMASGISVGGVKSHGSSKTYSNERILIIPPGGKSYMSEHKYEFLGGSSWNWEMISEAESYMIDVKPLNLRDGELREYDEKSSPYKVNYIITFSKDPSFNKYSNLNAGLYAKYILCKSVQLSGFKAIPSYPESFQSQSEAFKIYTKVIPDFEKLFGKIIIGRNYTED